MKNETQPELELVIVDEQQPKLSEAERIMKLYQEINRKLEILKQRRNERREH